PLAATPFGGPWHFSAKLLMICQPSPPRYALAGPACHEPPSQDSSEYGGLCRAEARLPLFRRVASMSAPCRISTSQKNSCAFSSLACQTCSRLCVALWLPNHPVLKKQPQIVAVASSPKNGGSEAGASNESLRTIGAIIS